MTGWWMAGGGAKIRSRARLCLMELKLQAASPGLAHVSREG